MKKLFSSILMSLGMGSATAGSQACHLCFFDEPECPKSLIK